jgi:hypothetical protein
VNHGNCFSYDYSGARLKKPSPFRVMADVAAVFSDTGGFKIHTRSTFDPKSAYSVERAQLGR